MSVCTVLSRQIISDLVGTYRGTSLTRTSTPRGPYRQPMPRVLGVPNGVGVLLWARNPFRVKQPRPFLLTSAEFRKGDELSHLPFISRGTTEHLQHADLGRLLCTPVGPLGSSSSQHRQTLEIELRIRVSQLLIVSIKNSPSHGPENPGF